MAIIRHRVRAKSRYLAHLRDNTSGDQESVDAVRLFLRSVLVLLLATAGFKLVGAFGREPILSHTSRLISFLSTRELMLIAAGCELVTAGALCFARTEVFKVRAIFTLAWIFFMYRVALWFFRIPEPCSCFGFLGSWLHLSEQHISILALLLLGYMLGGSAYFLFLRKKMQGRKIEENLNAESTRAFGVQ